MDHEYFLKEAQEYNRAKKAISEWIAGTHALALLHAALSSGIFDALRLSNTPAQVAAVTGVSKERVADICIALDACGIVDRENDTYRLAPTFAFLGSSQAMHSLSNILDAEKVKAHALESAALPDKMYTDLPSHDVLAMALGASVSPLSPLGLAYLAHAASAMPELQTVWEAGGRHMEIGSGVGNALLGLLVLYPKLTATGVEMNAEAVEEARRRAQTLGVNNRVELLQVDACSLTVESVFDTIGWSQFYFPTPSRVPVLAAALRALKPGGYLQMPLMNEPPANVEDLRALSGRTYTLNRLIYRSWGVPILSAGALQAEIEEIGFKFVRVVAVPPFRILLARSPQP